MYAELSFGQLFLVLQVNKSTCTYAQHFYKVKGSVLVQVSFNVVNKAVCERVNLFMGSKGTYLSARPFNSC